MLTFLLLCFIVQTFSPNPYFEDTKLTKTFSFADDGTTNMTGTAIKWREGMVSVLPFKHVVLLIILLSNASSNYNLKELANGDAHEKKGNKRPYAEERL